MVSRVTPWQAPKFIYTVASPELNGPTGGPMSTGDDERIVILGGGGFLGRHFCTTLREVHKPRMLCGIVNHTPIMGDFDELFSTEDPDWRRHVADWEPTIIVNMAAAWGSNDDNEAQVVEANIASPLLLLTEILRRVDGRRFRWVQVDSYFQLAPQIMATYRDLYSRCRAGFTEIGRALHYADGQYFLDIVLPHLTGPGESEYRLIPQLCQSLNRGERIPLSPGGQWLPILDVRDAARAILSLLYLAAPAESSASFSAPPVWYGSLRDAVEAFAASVDRCDLLAFGEVDYRQNEFFQRVRLPVSVPGWTPMITLDRIVEGSIARWR